MNALPTKTSVTDDGMALVSSSEPGRAQDSSSQRTSFIREETESQASHSEISVTLAGERVARLDAIVATRWATLHEFSGSIDQTAGAIADIPATVQEDSATGAEVAAAVNQPSATVAESSAVIPPAGATVAASPANGQFRGGIPSCPMTRFSEVLKRRRRKVPFPTLNPVPAP